MDTFDVNETYWSRAKADTISALGGGVSLFITLFAIPAVGFILHSLLGSGEDVMGEVETWLVYGLAAAGIVAIGLLAINLALAPHRQRNEARKVVTDRDRQISLLLHSRPELKVEIRGSISGGLLPNGSIAFCLPNIILSNIGDKPTTFELESLKFFSDAVEIESKIFHVDATFENGLDGKAVKVEAKNALYAIADNPIDPGARARGHLVAGLNKGKYTPDQPIEVEVCICDIYGNKYYGNYTSEGRSEPTGFIPGAKVVSSEHRRDQT